MRTNIVLDDRLISEAQRFSSARTKRAIVDEALRTFVAVKTEEQRRRSYRERLEEIQRQLAGRRFRESSADLIRGDRERR